MQQHSGCVVHAQRLAHGESCYDGAVLSLCYLERRRSVVIAVLHHLLNAVGHLLYLVFLESHGRGVVQHILVFHDIALSVCSDSHGEEHHVLRHLAHEDASHGAASVRLELRSRNLHTMCILVRLLSLHVVVERHVGAVAVLQAYRRIVHHVHQYRGVVVGQIVRELVVSRIGHVYHRVGRCLVVFVAAGYDYAQRFHVYVHHLQLHLRRCCRSLLSAVDASAVNLVRAFRSSQSLGVGSDSYRRLVEVGHHLRLYAVLDVGGIESLVGEHGVVTRIDAGLYGARRGIVAELQVDVVDNILAFVEHHYIVAVVGAALHLGVDAGMAYGEVVVEVVGALHHVGSARLAVVERHHSRHAALVGQVGVVERDVEIALCLGYELRTRDEVGGGAVVGSRRP